MAASRKPASEKHTQMWVSFPPRIQRYIDSLPIGGKSAAIVAAIEASPEYRAWVDQKAREALEKIRAGGKDV